MWLNKYNLTYRDAVGGLFKVPLEAIEKLLDYQREHSGKLDIAVIQTNSYKGPIWHNTKEGWEFWYRVIVEKDSELFYSKYPKEKIE